MRGTLYIQRDSKGRQIEKPKPIECDIDLGKDASAVAGVGPDMVAMLVRARVELISANGLFISGLVEGHYKGIPAVQYQEWWFVPIIAGREEQAVERCEH